MTERSVAIRVVMLPKDTNQMGTIFGGVILSHLDLAGSTEARKHAAKRVVTKVMENVEFLAPIFLGDTVSFYTQTIKVGRTAVTIEVDVEAERTGPEGHCETVKVTSARVVYVAVDENGRSIPIKDE
jgi:acyl-CoA thioesterase YciA